MSECECSKIGLEEGPRMPQVCLFIISQLCILYVHSNWGLHNPGISSLIVIPQFNRFWLHLPLYKLVWG